MKIYVEAKNVNAATITITCVNKDGSRTLQLSSHDVILTEGALSRGFRIVNLGKNKENKELGELKVSIIHKAQGFTVFMSKSDLKKIVSTLHLEKNSCFFWIGDKDSKGNLLWR